MSKTIVPALSCGFVSAAENDSLGTLASSPGGPGKQEKNREKPYLLCLFIFRKNHFISRSTSPGSTNSKNTDLVHL